jgi:hypothetical protein
MLSRILATAALTLGLAAGALAQTASDTMKQPNDPGNNSSTGTQMPMGNSTNGNPAMKADPNTTGSTTGGTTSSGGISDPTKCMDQAQTNAQGSTGSHETQGQGCK